MAVDVGRVGVWCSSRSWPQDPGAAAEAAAELEELGYQAIWLGISPGTLEQPEALLAATSRLAVATGIASVWDSQPGAVAAAYHRVCDASPGRFLLGLGASHAHVVERGGGTYERPYRKVAEFLDGLDTATLPVPAGGRALAALGPRMLALAGRRTAGAHPYLVTPEHAQRAREILGDGPLLAPEQKAVVTTDPDAARALGRPAVDRPYLHLRNYTSNLKRLGWTDADLADGGSDPLIDELVVHGDAATVARGVTAHLDAGADHVCLQLLTAPDADPRPDLEALADALRLPD